MTFLSQPSSLFTWTAVCHTVPLRLTKQNILLVSNLSHLSYISHPFQPSYLITLIMRDMNQNAVLDSHPCELNVPPIWMFLFNYSNDIRWEAQMTNLKEQNLLRALHIWPIPSVLSLAAEAYSGIKTFHRLSKNYHMMWSNSDWLWKDLLYQIPFILWKSILT
jgi:hypothetical protein